MICTITNIVSNNTVGEVVTLHVHKAAGRLAEDFIDMFSRVHSKCQTRADVSGHINKSFERVIIAD